MEISTDADFENFRKSIFQSSLNHEIFVKLNLPIFVVLVGQQEKSQRYFDLSAFN